MRFDKIFLLEICSKQLYSDDVSKWKKKYE